MTPELQREIEKYLSKKNVYYKNFSNELQVFLESNYPNLSSIKARWYMLKNGLTDIPICAFPDCNENAKWNDRNKSFDSGCCTDHIKRITSLSNFGTEHPNQSIKQQRKVKKSIRSKYGVDYITQTDIHKNSVKETVQEKYGVDNILQSSDIREKIKKTNINRYGFENPTSNIDVREKVKQTNLKKLGVEESLSSPEVRSKVYKTNLERYGSIFPMRNAELLAKRRESIIEKYDSYSPNEYKEDKKKYYHLDKSIEAENKGDIYYYFFKNEIVDKKPQIDWVVNQQIIKIVADVEFKVISNEERDQFIVENSLYLKDSAIRKNFGVFADNEMVAIFSGYEKEDYFEITRFVVGIGVSFSKNIFKLFLKHINKSKSIISFDRRFTPYNQPLLIECGFEFVGGTEPKQHSIEEWDCGKLVYKKC